MCEVNKKVDLNADNNNNLIKFIYHPCNDSFRKKDAVKFRAKDFLLLFSLSYCCFTGYASFSFLAPFYPRVAESKGLSTTQYGLVFAVYEITRFIISPFSGNIAIRMTPKIFLITGIIISSLSSTIFGTLIYEEDSFRFFAFSILVRICWAFGGTATITSTYLISSLLLKNHLSQVFSAIETSVGLGYMLGPWFGGILFEYGGFSLPFYVMFFFNMISTIPIYFLVNNELTEIKDNNEKKTSSFEALKIPELNITFLISIFTSFLCAFNDSTLDYHIREFSMYTASQTGFIFLISSLFYCIFTQFWGYFIKKYSKSYGNSIYIGYLFTILCFIFNGPIYGLPLEPNIYLVILSQISLAMGVSNLYLISFNKMFDIGKINLPDNDSTLAVISGLSLSTYALGNSIGPAFGGYLLTIIGYRKLLIIINVLIILMTFITIYFSIKIKSKTFNLVFLK